MNVLSLFDGISCGQVALEHAGIKVDRYFACEIKPEAIKVTQHNYPKTIQLGDVTKVDGQGLPRIDILIGGSPCQGFSNAGKMLNFDDPRSKLFFEYVRLLKELKPKYFLLENVRMKQEWQDIISEHLGVKPIRINSKLVSAQLRDRYYWTNIPVEIPEDRGILLQDILENGITDRLKSRAILESEGRPLRNQEKMLRRYIQTGFTTIIYDNINTLLRVKEATNVGYTDIYQGQGVDLSYPTSKTRRGRAMRDKLHTITEAHNEYYLFEGETIRYLTQTELERCQTLPDGYTSILARNKAAGCIGDGWTVDVISHIFNGININD